MPIVIAACGFCLVDRILPDTYQDSRTFCSVSFIVLNQQDWFAPRIQLALQSNMTPLWPVLETESQGFFSSKPVECYSPTQPLFELSHNAL